MADGNGTQQLHVKFCMHTAGSTQELTDDLGTNLEQFCDMHYSFLGLDGI